MEPIQVILHQQRQSELQREAQEARLVKQSDSQLPFKAQIGQFLIRFGEQLQVDETQINSETELRFQYLHK